MNPAPTPRFRSHPGFSLLELLVAMVIGMVIMVLLVQITSYASNEWQRTRQGAEAFQAARAAFDALTRTLSQATLNTEYDYYNVARQSRQQLAATSGESALASFIPNVYGRASGLHFVSGKNLISDQHTHAIFFQAPLDFTSHLTSENAAGQLNSTGFYLRYDPGSNPALPTSLPERPRYRLMQYFQPTESLDVYRETSGTNWFTGDLNTSPAKNTHLLAENILVLTFLPMNSQGTILADNYEYDSRVSWNSGNQPEQMHQLPSLVRVLMVAIDERSALRAPELGRTFDGLFQDPQYYDRDLKEVEDTLIEAKANYQIFQTDVPIRSSKWTR